MRTIKDSFARLAGGAAGLLAALVLAPRAGQLAANGGPTQTLALAAGIPAIDSGNGTGCGPVDQHGVGNVALSSRVTLKLGRKR